jgi:phosphoesterase RecJ-like protein
MLELTPAVEFLSRYDRIIIFCHEEPDGDALGASLALAEGLRILGKTAAVACKDTPAPPFRFLPGIQTIVSAVRLDDFQAVVVVDCGDLARTGFADQLRRAGRRGIPILNIDHHPENDLHRLATVTLTDTEVAASVQIITLLLDRLNVPLSPALATLLLTGLYTDTGGFRHTNTTPEVLRLASRLLLHGARFKKIVRNISSTKTFAALRLWGIALSRARRHSRFPLVTTIITKDDLAACRATPEDLGGVVNMINAIPGTKAAILFVELPDKEIKVSVRTETDGVDVARLAAVFGGGGHRKAAGFRLRGRLVKERGYWRIARPALAENLLAV